jgi:hypothetical protein
MADETDDIHVKQFGPQTHILDHGRSVAVAIATADGGHKRLITETSAIGNLITYLSRARTRAIERLNAAGIDHRVTTSLDAGTVIDPKSVNFSVASDMSHAVLQVADAQGNSIGLRLTPDLALVLAEQMVRAHKDMTKT